MKVLPVSTQQARQEALERGDQGVRTRACGARKRAGASRWKIKAKVGADADENSQEHEQDYGATQPRWGYETRSKTSENFLNLHQG